MVEPPEPIKEVGRFGAKREDVLPPLLSQTENPKRLLMLLYYISFTNRIPTLYQFPAIYHYYVPNITFML